MDAKVFLAEFGHIASAPGGVQRLREMIRSLAVTGDLVLLDSRVDARPLLESITRQRAGHPDAKRVVEPQLPLSAVEKVRAPAHWAPCRLGDLVLTITGGGTPSKTNPGYWGGDIPWASVKDLKDDKYLEKTEDRITREGLINSSSNLIPPDQVIVCTRMGLGKLAVTKFETAINQDLKAFALPPEVDIDFFCLLYRTLNITGKGTTVSGITQDKLLAYPTALPPIDEQKHIVAKVDELMSLCDKLEAQQQQRETLCRLVSVSTIEAISNAQSASELLTVWQRFNRELPLLVGQSLDLEVLHSTILDLAAQGKLSEPRTGDSRASDLLEKAKVSRSHRISAGEVRTKRSLPTDIKLLGIPVPSHWVEAPVEDLFQFIDYRGQTPIKTSSGRVLVTAKNVRPGKIAADPVEYIAKDDYVGWMTRGFPREGDLLITTEAPLGNVARIDNPPDFALAQRVIDLQPYAEMNTRYVMYFMMSPSFQKLLWANATGTTAKGIKAAKLKRLPLSVPPIEEQDRIVSRVENLLSICSVLEAQLAKAKSTAEKLARACTSAITGIRIEDKEEMKAPKTELVSRLRLGVSPADKDQAPLAALLIRNNGELAAKALWQMSGLEIDDFYRQLKTEMARGWIVEPEPAYVREVAA